MSAAVLYWKWFYTEDLHDTIFILAGAGVPGAVCDPQQDPRLAAARTLATAAATAAPSVCAGKPTRRGITRRRADAVLRPLPRILSCFRKRACQGSRLLQPRPRHHLSRLRCAI